MAKSSLIRILFAALILFTLGPVSHCAAFAVPVKAKLITEYSTVKAGQSFKAAVVFEMEPGWHIYWRNSGDSGIPSEIEWQLQKGFVAGSILWPVPERIESSGLITYGYHGRTALVSEVQTPIVKLAGIMNVEIKAKVIWLACQKICVPGQADLSTAFNMTSSEAKLNPAWDSEVNSLGLKFPEHWNFKKLRVLESSTHLWLELPSDCDWPAGMRYLPYDPGIINEQAPQQFIGKGKRRGLMLSKASNTPKSIGQLTGLLLIPSKAYEITEQTAFDPSGIPSGHSILNSRWTITIAVAVLALMVAGIYRRMISSSKN